MSRPSYDPRFSLLIGALMMIVSAIILFIFGLVLS